MIYVVLAARAEHEPLPCCNAVQVVLSSRSRNKLPFISDAILHVVLAGKSYVN